VKKAEKKLINGTLTKEEFEGKIMKFHSKCKLINCCHHMFNLSKDNKLADGVVNEKKGRLQYENIASKSVRARFANERQSMRKHCKRVHDEKDMPIFVMSTVIGRRNKVEEVINVDGDSDDDSSYSGSDE
jgi:hypothetical protein